MLLDRTVQASEACLIRRLNCDSNSGPMRGWEKVSVGVPLHRNLFEASKYLERLDAFSKLLPRDIVRGDL